MAEAQPALAHTPAPDSRYLTSKPDIAACLKQLRDQRMDLTLRLEGTNESYTCKILDVNDNDFLIEDISPRSGIQVLRVAPKFSISARDQGTYVYIEETRVTKWDQERGIPFFHVAFPKQMLFQQRRRAARFRLPMRVSATGASITLFNSNTLVGRIIDISAGGCRAEFDLPTQWDVHNEERFENCAITIPKLLEIHSEAVVRHYHQNKHNQTLVCGIELTKMHVTDRRRLEHFIQTITRTADSA
jgi:c-di-GMP-binding flagellar brake protein YcgR